MVINVKENHNKLIKYINILNYKFERVQSFTYLGSLLSDNNDLRKEINQRIQRAN